jgi:hypothetical protein
VGLQTFKKGAIWRVGDVKQINTIWEDKWVPLSGAIWHVGDVKQTLITTTWYIWWIRRQKVHGEIV